MKGHLKTLTILFFIVSLTGCATQGNLESKTEIRNDSEIRQKEQISVKKNVANPELNLDEALSDLTSQIVNSMTEGTKKKVAVIEFSNLKGNVSEFGKYLAEELITRLFMTRKFEVIERRLLNKVLSEQKLSLSDLIDPDSIVDLGKILGVDAIVSGTITDLGTSLKVNARIISTETGLVFAVAATDIIKNKIVKNLMVTEVAGQKHKTSKIEKIENKPTDVKRGESGSIFFIEDFSKIKEGNFPEKWIGGETLIVSYDRGQKFITPFEGQNHNFSVVDIDFPQNFKFEWTLQTAPPGWWAHTAIIGDVKIKFDSNGNRVQMNNTEKRINNIAGRTIKISLEKYDDVFRLFIDGRQIIIARYPRYRSPKGFSFEFKFPQFKLYKIVGMSL